VSGVAPVLGSAVTARRAQDRALPAAEYDAVLLVSFGGPEGQGDVIPFLRNVTHGRGIADERLEEVAHHYRAFGGVSPINAQNRALKAALEAELAARGIPLPVYWGNRNWDPYLPQALLEVHDAGHRNVLAVVTSAYSSYSGCRQYREDLARALDRTGLAGELRIDKVRQYFDHPGFVAPFVAGVAGALRRLLEQQPGLDLAREVHVLFSTHSIPIAAAELSGPREGVVGEGTHDGATLDGGGAADEPAPGGAIVGEGGWYAAQHRAVAEVVIADLAEEFGVVPFSLVYQSRSGAPGTPWLEPDVNDAIRDLAADAATRAVVIVPLGFVSDHMEVKWDLDEEASATAREAGLMVERTPTPGADPAFVAGLVDLIEERTVGAPRKARTGLGPWQDVCPSDCCATGRALAPTVAGLPG